MKTAVICAGGAFPLALVEALHKQHKPYFLVLLKNLADEKLNKYPHIVLPQSHIAKIIKVAKAQDCQQICFVGSLTRPNPFSLLPDLKTLLMAPQLIKAFKGGDNHLLTSLGKLFERHSLKLVGAHEIAPSLLAPLGVWGKITANKQDLLDIKIGVKAARAIGKFDTGQALVLSDSHIVALEGVEGTDAMIRRVADYRLNGTLNWQGKRGILVKAMKPNQNNRIDMPAIGVETVKNASLSSFRGIAVEAKATLVLDMQAVINEADKHGMFIMGV
jgi:UDP-2,3-diacylglucosamine hydrolase